MADKATTHAVSGALSTVHRQDATGEIKKIREKLTMSEEWCSRLQRQIQELLRLPYNDTEKLRAKMNNPEIAIPLLQCYDAAIKEKEEENSRLLKELDRLRTELRNIDGTDRDNAQTARLAEETARAAIMRAESDVQLLQDQIARLSSENAHYKERIIILNENETRMKAHRSKDAKDVEEANAQVLSAKKLQGQLEAEIENLNRKLRTKSDEEDGDRHSAEAQRIQLHLLSKENEDKVSEIERLRGKMVVAVKQAAENHTTHMKIMEEKHRANMDALREEIRSHEVTILKLRAQLSRVDLINNASREGSRHGHLDGRTGIPSTADAIQAQIYQTQEIELKKMYAEVASLQSQRDESLFRVEQLTQSRKGEQDELIRQLRKDIELLRGRHNEAMCRNEKLEQEVQMLKEQTLNAKDAQRLSAREQLNEKKNYEAIERKYEDVKRQLKIMEDTLEESEKQHSEEMEEERKKYKAAARREEDRRQDDQLVRDRLNSRVMELERTIEDLRNTLRETHSKLQAAEASLTDKHHLLEVSNIRIEQLGTSLSTHKYEIQQADERLVAYQQQESIMREDLRRMALEVEQLRLENMRCAKDQERAVMEMNAVKRFGIINGQR